ncbi:MAG TPA: hypothetical protein VJ783_24160 [Pirellulales bacterium]|nr:hypothetical protein [Pirellulales bacterium]
MSADEIRRRVPNGRMLPARFGDLLRAELQFRVEWNALDDYGLKPSAMNDAVPFLRLPDGGVVALWYHSVEPAIVHIGAYGELQVIASNFENFLSGIEMRCCGLPDIDEGEASYSVPGVCGRPDLAGLPALQEKFDKWFKQHTSLLEPFVSRETELLRKRLLRIAEDMIRDGCSKVYTLSSPWWSMDFRIERDDEELSITYLDFGEWYRVPTKYKIGGVIEALLSLAKNKKLRQYEVSICSAGIVSIDRDRELVLVPPDSATD